MGGTRPPPFTTFTLTSKVAVYAPAEWADTLTLFHLSALEYSTRVVREGGRRCKKSTLNDLVHLTPLRIPLMNPPTVTMALASANLGSGPQSTYIGRDETGSVYLPAQLERTPQLYC